MFDHVGLQVSDLSAGVRFYRAALAPLGYELVFEDDASAGFGPKGAAALWLYPRGKKITTSGTHLAFAAPDRAAVDRFHAAAMKSGGKDHGEPGVRKDYSPTYYAAFVLDPDGNNVEAVFLK